MDQVLVQEIDNLLKMKLPKKSSISGAEWVGVNPENTQSLALSTASTYRYRLPRRGYLARSRGQTGPFMSFGLSTSAVGGAAIEVYAVYKQCRILVNGTEVHNNQYFNHYYCEWLKKKPTSWLSTDGQNFGLVSDVGASPFGAQDAATIPQTTVTYFTLPFPDNYSVLSNKNSAIPLEYLDIVIEMTLNNANNIATRFGADGEATDLKMANPMLYIPVVYVAPEINDAIRAKLEMASSNDAEMMLIPVDDIRVDAQSYSFAATGTKTFVWNSVSSMCRLLEAKISTDSAALNEAYKTATGLTGGCSQYIFKVNGANVTQNPVTTESPNLAYPLFQDLASAYNQINNDLITSSPITPTVFLGSADSNPAREAALASSFSMVANLDTVSQDLVGGVKLINNLTLDITNTVAGAAGSNVYLIQHSNRIIGVSSTSCKVLR